MTRRTLLALGALSLLTTLTLPARSAPPSADVRGSYFGTFTNSANNVLYSDLNVTLQDKKVIAGSFSMGAVLQGVHFTGKCSPSGKFTATGFVQHGEKKLRVRLTGTHVPGGSGALAELEGTYTVSGPLRDRGTFFFSGGSRG